MQLFPQRKEMGRLRSFLEEAQLNDKILLTISFKDTSDNPGISKLLELSDRFSDSVSRNLSEYVKHSECRINDSIGYRLYNTVLENLPLFLEESDYLMLGSLTRPDIIRQKIHENYEPVISPAGFSIRDRIKKNCGM